MNHLTKLSTVAAAAASLYSAQAFACAGCGCTLSSDWDSQGFVAKPGLRIDLRYDYLNQSQLRSGGDLANRSSLIDTGKEIEKDTISRYTTMSVDYSPNKDWGVNVQLPYLNRSHSTYGEVDAPDTLQSVETSDSHTRSIGDIKIVGRYQGLTDAKNFGVQFGLKLPTGSFNDKFNSGDEDGNTLDRGLQPGTGTTDALAGLYYFTSMSQDWDFFVQGMAQTALNSRDHYRPGNSLSGNTGVRYMGYEWITPQLQINARSAEKDSGSNSDKPNSGGTLAYISPGLTVNVSDKFKVYGFTQFPIYQHVNGYQLTPTWTGTVGMHYSF